MPSRIGDALHWHATYTPNKAAVISTRGVLTYSQLWSRACGLVNALGGLGLEPGDRIAVLMYNSAQYIEVYQATALMGLAVVPLNFRFVASEIEYVINHSGARAIIFDGACSEVVQALRSRMPTIGKRFIISDGPETPDNYSYESLLDSADRGPPAVPADLSACYFQGYTSGT